MIKKRNDLRRKIEEQNKTNQKLTSVIIEHENLLNVLPSSLDKLKKVVRDHQEALTTFNELKTRIEETIKSIDQGQKVFSSKLQNIQFLLELYSIE